jgi:putative addiction module killer protein
MEIRRYVTESGKDVFGEWFAKLKDARTMAKVVVRIDRLAANNFGDSKGLRGGLFELRIDWGPGYRVYYAKVDKVCALLLCGGTSANSRTIYGALSNIFKITKKGQHEAQGEHISR